MNRPWTEASLAVEGRAWVFGDNISTDLIMPSRGLRASIPGRSAVDWCFHANRPGWAAEVSPGDLVFAGRNFGCGSGRAAPDVLRDCGISGIVAASVARTFFRNAISIGLPVMICPAVVGQVREGQILRVDFHNGLVTDSDGREFVGEALPADSPPAQILAAGGFEPFLRTVLTMSAEERSVLLGLAVTTDSPEEQS
ncbi:hypothetical protein [Kribbella sp. NPDC051718]|uniref:LeuD/DmdB family oxidoreductase small subunit n=1 Tax=Kribbella sp. NPDC051718 TaxID=3155168 RepID=UPI0034440559